MNKGLLVDIGGTNMRYAIASNNQEDISKINKTEFDTLDFETFLRKLVVDNGIDTLIISIAGPKINNSIRMTNRDYSINSDQLKKNLNLKDCIILNDWEAIAYSYEYISKDIETLKDGSAFNNTKLFLGPGTGLGAAVSIDEIVFPTEIGNTLNSSLKLQRNYDIQDDSLLVLEDLVSGTAISKIYELKTNKKLSSEKVYEKFKENDEIALKVINGFIKSLAETLSDLALTFLPGEGIFLAGSLIRNLYKDINKDDFNKAFIGNRKDAHKNILDMISINVIMKERTPLYGNLKLFKTITKDCV